jgi:2-C-methyl-D-erythritol 4-phosphate cytidylyltransferase
MLLHALRPFTSHAAVIQVVVALPPEHAAAPPDWLGRLAGERLVLVPGGATRADSVRAGLAALTADAGVVLVHDGARPFVSRETIDAVIARARGGVGAIAAVPVSDTLKEANGNGHVARTVPRDRLWRAQTPQGFPRAMLLAAYAAAPGDPPPSDDAAACERAGFPVDVVPDSTGNIKVTTAEDFEVAEALARQRR